MAIDSGGRISEIAVQNVNPNPGFTDFVVLIYDRTGVVDFVCEKLNARQAEYIDLDAWPMADGRWQVAPSAISHKW